LARTDLSNTLLTKSDNSTDDVQRCFTFARTSYEAVAISRAREGLSKDGLKGFAFALSLQAMLTYFLVGPVLDSTQPPMPRDSCITGYAKFSGRLRTGQSRSNIRPKSAIHFSRPHLRFHAALPFAAQLLHGELPSMALASRISDATAGDVTPNDFAGRSFHADVSDAPAPSEPERAS